MYHIFYLVDNEWVFYGTWKKLTEAADYMDKRHLSWDYLAW